MTTPDVASRRPAELGLLATLLDGDPGAAYSLLSGLMAKGATLDQVLFDVLAPVQRDIGARWIAADHGVGDEHAASAAVETVVALLAGLFDKPVEGPEIVVACAEGDRHSLPARMVAAYLSYLEWRVTFLGATLPAAELGEFLADNPPEAVLLSASMVTNLLGARLSIRAAHAAGVPVVAGGRAFTAARAIALGADGWVADPRELPDMLTTWTPNIAAAEAGAVAIDAAEALADALPAAIASAAQRDTGGVSRAGVRADLRLLGGALVAASLLDEPAILHDLAAWHETRRAAHGDALSAARLAELLAAELPGPAADLLGAVR